MKGLILDTTLKRSYVAVIDGEREEIRYFDESLSTQSALIPACREALSALGISPADLDGIAAVVGPGSFTGIRIGVAFANAVAFAVSTTRFSFTSFDLMRFVRPDAPCYMIDAGHNSAYVARLVNGVLVEENMEKIGLPEGTVDQKDIIEDLPKGAIFALRKALEEKIFSAYAPTAETPYLKPNYMRKSQAERMKDRQE